MDCWRVCLSICCAVVGPGFGHKLIPVSEGIISFQNRKIALCVVSFGRKKVAIFFICVFGK